MEKFIAASLEQMPAIAKTILKKISPTKPLLLNGELGAGKTTLTKYIAKELGIKEVVNSPSFVIMKIYTKLIHIDAYRIKGSLEEYSDYFDGKKYIVIEWSNNVEIPFESYLKIDVYLKDNKHIFEVVEDK